MLDRETAKMLVGEDISQRSSKRPDFELMVDDSATIETEYGWIFCYQTKLFIETRNTLYKNTGCYPILVDKLYKTLIPVGLSSLESWLKKYEKRRVQPFKLPDDDKLSFFLKCYLRKIDIGGFPNEKAAIDYYVTYAKFIDILTIIKQGKIKIAKTPFPWQDINSMTNRSLKNERQTRQWLEKVIKLIESTQSVKKMSQRWPYLYQLEKRML
ncbi:MAG: YrhB family protein [Hydrococcus sp. Prado102]|jgi:hypothetical protein|nr:YrhB family protein [Hydrococcus sp. Prado102]